MAGSTGSYFDTALSYTNAELMDPMESTLRGVEYDTIVGTGLSGTIFTARVAPGLGKKFAIVRKKDDKSTHSGTVVEGHVGKRYVFADDFVSSGATMKRVLRLMKENHPDAEFVGVYQYEYTRFTPASECDYEWGNWVSEIAMGGPLYGPLTKEEFVRRYPWDKVVRDFPEGGWAPEVAAKLPLPPLGSIELGYAGENGRPTYWSRMTGQIASSDPRIQEIGEEIYRLTDGRFVRYVGMRLDAVLRTLRGNALSVRTRVGTLGEAVPVKEMEKFVKAVAEADAAMKSWDAAGFLEA